MAALSVFLLSAVSLASVAAATLVSINNTAPRLDTSGAIVDGHDLSLRVVVDATGTPTYVMHTIEYGLCVAPPRMGCDQQPDHCGFRPSHNITVWTTPTLESGSWTKVGDAFPLAARPAGLVFRPDAIYNPNTEKWVLWYNFAGGGNTYVSATSSSYAGPFTGFAVTNATNAVWEGGDFHLVIDDTKTSGPAEGYLIWTGMSKQPGLDHKIRISRLTPDFLAVTDDEPYMFNFPETEFNEAPSLFSRNGVWYALFGAQDKRPTRPAPPNAQDMRQTHCAPQPGALALTRPTLYPLSTTRSGHCCCYCEQGSGLFVFTAATPMGPWTPQTSPTHDISCQAPSVLQAVGATGTGIPTPGQGCLYGGSNQVAVTRSQQDFVAKLPDGSGGFTFLYYGSRWGQSPDSLKGHEPQYVYPLVFDASGHLQHIVWQDVVTFSVA